MPETDPSAHGIEQAKPGIITLLRQLADDIEQSKSHDGLPLAEVTFNMNRDVEENPWVPNPPVIKSTIQLTLEWRRH